MDARMQELAEQYTRYRAAAMETQRRMASVTVTATSPKGLVTAVVGARGELRSLVFNSRKYRDLAPAELAHAIVETVELARRGVLREMAEGLPAGLSGGVSVADMLAGDIDVSKLLPENLLIDPPVNPFAPPRTDARTNDGRS